MWSSRVILTAAVVCLSAGSSSTGFLQPPSTISFWGAPVVGGIKAVPEVPGKAGSGDAYGKLPLSFVANHGQSDPQVKFLARGKGYTLFLTANEVVLALRKSGSAPRRIPGRLPILPRGERQIARVPKPQELSTAVVRMSLVGANPSPSVVGANELFGKANYFIGSNSARWRTGVPTYAKVKYQDVYPGVDLIFYGNQQQVEYDFVVAPGADPGVIQVAFEGAQKLRLDGRGDLILQIERGELRLHKPVVGQKVNGVRREIASWYVLNPHSGSSNRQSGFRNRKFQTVGIHVASYDVSRPLVIDPVLSYSTYLGGSDTDFGFGIAADSAGNAYVTGLTRSADFPTTVGAFDTTQAGAQDVFVTKVNAAGSALVYSTFLGGSGTDQGEGIAVDAAGNAYVTGLTLGDFPTTPGAFDTTFGGTDAFVFKLNATGSALLYSTYLGEASTEGRGIAVDSAGNAYVTGFTSSLNFPTVSPVQATLGGGGDAFVTKLNAAGSALVYSTYLGGSDRDIGNSIAVDSSGNAYVTGETASTNFPTTLPTLQGASGGGPDAFVTKLDAAGSVLVYSTYLGGTLADGGNGIAVDAAGNAYVTGITSSLNFPKANPVQPPFAGVSDAFVTKLDAAGSVLVYSTYLGGTLADGGNGIAVDAAGNAYVTGFTSSLNFPIASPVQAASGGGADAFVTKLNAGGFALVFSTYLGGSGDDVGRGIAVDAAGNAYVTGDTVSTNFPTASFQAASGGGRDAFVAKVGESSEPPVGVSPTPSGSSGCFVATAAYGSSLDAYVQVLREFRDEHLMTHPVGRVLVRLYYRHAPPIATIIARHEVLRLAARAALTPVVYAVSYPVGAGAASMAAALAGFSLRRRYRKRWEVVACVHAIEGSGDGPDPHDGGRVGDRMETKS